MAASIPSTEPAVIISGDSVYWNKSFSDYPVSEGWALSYAFRQEQGNGIALNVSATSANDTFSLTIPAASSNLMKAGLWKWASYVTLSTDRYQVGEGTITVKPNLATIDFTTDLRSDAKVAYDNALAAWKSVKLGQTVTLNGRTYTQHNLDALTAFVDRCRADYMREVDTEKLNLTGVNTRRIGVRFSRV